MQRVRVLLLIPRLGGGGAQRVMALLARDLSKEKYDVHLGLVTAADAGAAALPPWVTIHALGAGRVRGGAIALLRLVWQLRPEVILPGAAEVNFLALMLGPFFPLRTKILVRQNGTVSSALAFGGVPRYTRWLYRIFYRRADRVICQSHAMAEDMAREIHIDETRIAVLPNPVNIEEIRAAMSGPSTRSGGGPHLLAVGRLEQEKGFDLLLRALPAVRERFPGVDLIVAGVGSEEAALKLLSRTLYLQGAVSFVGYIERIYALFPGTALYVLSSRYEGMPNSLLEAAAGLPLVATPASQGVVDLLREQPGSWLTPEISAEAIAETLIGALDSIRPGDRFRRAFFPSTADEATRAGALSGQAYVGRRVAD